MTHSNSLTPTTLVISVGGSLVVPNGGSTIRQAHGGEHCRTTSSPLYGIDYQFLKDFKALITRHIKNGWKFVIVVGGGGTARHYQDAARKVGKLTREDLDWLGIHSTRLNGHLMRTIFRDMAHPIMIKDPTGSLARWHKPVLVAAGWKPGWSTDYVATRLAKRLKSPVVVNLSNVDYVYDKDPHKHSDAEAICDITWKEFRKLVGDEWDPGMNVPFDPVASRLAHHSGIKVAILNGKNLANLDGLLKGQRFVGTVIGS